MNREKHLGAIVIVVAAWLVLGAGAVGGEQNERIAIPEYAVTHESVVHLSDLLPANAGGVLRELAEAVVVGEAPVPGSVRDFSRERIEVALRSTPNLQSALDVPPVVHVTRSARILASEEIVHAVQRSLEASKLPEAAELAGATVRWAAPVYLASEDSAPEATSVDFSGGSGVIRARIWIPSEPRVMPFWVEIGTAGTNGAAPPAAVKTVSFEQSGSAAEPSRAIHGSKTVLMVQSGKTVTLALCAPGMRITTNAAAMQSGGPGDVIRVRVLPSGKQFVAKVVGPSEVEANY